jgi:UDP-2,3-diacylglucosamine hydrolase
MSVVRFISDLHLSEHTPEFNRWFEHSLREWAHDEIDALYILGDWFDYWVGDDDQRPFIQSIEQACRQFTHHKSLYVMHGNRDFLVGEDFTKRCGAQLLREDVHVLGNLYLLCHGDHLCVDDVPYQAFRQQSRQVAWQQRMLQQSLPVRHALAQQIRQESQELGYLVDVSQEAVSSLCAEYPQARVLIHGHTHLPNRHTLENGVIRWVLQDWREDRYGYLDVELANPQNIKHTLIHQPQR